MRPLNNLETRLSETFEEFSYYVWKFRLTVLYNHHWNTIRTRCLWWIKVHYDFLTILGVIEICNFKLVLEWKTGKEIPKSSRLGFLKKFLEDNFALSEPEDNASGLINRGGIPDLHLLRTLSAICQQAQEPSFLKVMDSFVLIA